VERRVGLPLFPFDFAIASLFVAFVDFSKVGQPDLTLSVTATRIPKLTFEYSLFLIERGIKPLLSE
jgi:hypothetical protein